ncbi:MAG: thiolase domain-containing protein [Candidatus Hadarchaeales archaeon]
MNMFRKASVVGCGMTKFGRHDDKTLLEMLTEASLKALDDAGLGEKDVDAIYVSNMLGGELTRQTALATALSDQLGMFPVAADRVENGPASGGSAVKNASLAIASGVFDRVLVVGGEKMRHVSGETITDYIATMTHPLAEYPQGATLPSLAGMLARLYMHRYGVKRDHLAMIAVKNHENALKNPYAHIRTKITMEGILYSPEAEQNNPLVADPLRLYDCCPITDGAAALVLSSSERAREFTDSPVVVEGIGQANDTLALHERKDPTVLYSVRSSAKRAFDMAKIGPEDVDVAELHDAFTILELAESEDAGFFEKGTGHKAVEEGATQIGGKLPINPSGGLKARGHPVGATGVAQVVEITWQLRGEADERQVKGAEIGFTCNFGGFGNNVVSFVFRRGD